MATIAAKTISPTCNDENNIPQWKKDLIARLKNQNKKSEERLWLDHHPIQAHHPHPRTELVCPVPSGNGFGKDVDSPGSSDSEDLHYGPGIVNKLRNKYLSLALRESNTRPTILRKATSLENLLDDDGGEEGDKGDAGLFVRRNVGVDGGGNRYRSANRRQEMKRARSVEVISRVSHDEELTMTTSMTYKINNRQSLHEDMLNQKAEEKASLIENSKSYKRPLSIENGIEDTAEKYGRRLNRPKRIAPLLNEKEKPPVDVVKHAKMIFEKKPETRTKKPQHTGEVAAKVDSFNDIIIKTKGGLKPTKQTKLSKPVLTDKNKCNTHHQVRPVAKPVILSEEMMAKPKSLDLNSPSQEKKGLGSLPSPIPDVSRVDIKPQDGTDPVNNSLCETPDLILTSSPLPKITSPTYRKRSTEDFIKGERNGSFLGHIEATNKYVSPIHSPTRVRYPKLRFNTEGSDSLGIKMVSPITQKNITKSAPTAVFNFVNVPVDQRHLPSSKGAEVNGFTNGNKIKMGLSSFETERNLKNAAKSEESANLEPNNSPDGLEARTPDKSWQNLGNNVGKTSSIFENLSKADPAVANHKIHKAPSELEEDSVSEEATPPPQEEFNKKVVISAEKVVLKPVQSNSSASDTNSVVDSAVLEDRAIKIVQPKKTKPKGTDDSTIAVFNFTARKDVPDYITNDTSRAPSRPVIPKADEPGVKLLPNSELSDFIKEALEEDELIKSLEARPPSPCDVTFINDNILIDGRSSLIHQTSKRTKLKISFVDDADIYEYPSETSLLLDEASHVGHTVPALTGSSLATYTPKTTEDFQLGVTKSFQESATGTDTKPDKQQSDAVLEEIEKPVLFSSGSTSDILF